MQQAGAASLLSTAQLQWPQERRQADSTCTPDRFLEPTYKTFLLLPSISLCYGFSCISACDILGYWLGMHASNSARLPAADYTTSWNFSHHGAGCMQISDPELTPPSMRMLSSNCIANQRVLVIGFWLGNYVVLSLRTPGCTACSTKVQPGLAGPAALPARTLCHQSCPDISPSQLSAQHRPFCRRAELP